MESIGQIIYKTPKFQEFLEKGKELKKKMLAEGFIKTNFGWMHKDWISEAFKNKWIAGKDPMAYRLVINYSLENSMQHKGRSQWAEEKESAVLDMVDDPRKPGTKTMRFFKWLEDKRDVYKQVHQEFLETTGV